MRHARKYVVGYKGTGFVYDASKFRHVYPETWKEAVDVVENRTLAEAGDVVEVYALVPVAAWKCVKGKDGTRKMVKVKVSTRVIEAAERAKAKENQK